MGIPMKNLAATLVFAICLLSSFSLSHARFPLNPDLAAFARVEDVEVEDVDVKATEEGARISPQIEFVLPTGDITYHFLEQFNYLELILDLNAGIVDNRINGEITLAYPFNHIRPYATFIQKVDFESYIDPKLSGGNLVLESTDKYISRDRGAATGIGFTVFPHVTISP